MDIINSDAYWWKTRAYNFGNAISTFDLASTAQTYHPGVTLMWVNYVSIKIFTVLNNFIFNNSLSEKDLFLVNHIIQKTFLVIVLSVLVTLAFHKISTLFNKKFALYFFVLFTFSPFVVGLTRVLHTDALLTMFIFLSFLYLYGYFLDYKRFGLFFAGIFYGLALLTKSNALIFLPLVFCIIVIENMPTGLFSHFNLLNFVKRFDKDNVKSILTELGLFLLTSFITFVATWPAVWVTPFKVFSNYLFGITSVGIEEGHVHFFKGVLTNNPGLTYYIYAFFGRVDEVLMVLFLLGVLLYIKNKKWLDNKHVFYSLLFIIIFLVTLSFPSKKLDRYILPIFPFVVVIAVFFVENISRYLRLKFRFIFFILLFNLLILNLNYHPDYLAYYSRFIGGSDNGRYFVDNTWAMGYPKLAAYFNKLDRASDLKVAVHDDHSFRPYFSGTTVEIENNNERKTSDYIVAFSYYPEDFSLDGFEEIAIFDVAGVPYYKIYKNPNRNSE